MIVKAFSYFGIKFSLGGSFSNAQAQKAVLKLSKYLYNFADLIPRHVLDLIDKLVSPILCYFSEAWVFCKADKIEKAHKALLGVKHSTLNTLIYGALGRMPYQMLATLKLY